MKLFAALPFALTLGLAAQTAQSPFGDLQSKPAKKSASVAYLFPEQITVAADKPATLDLHFKVAEGLHVNSHYPHGEGLIPTTLNLPEKDGIRLAKVTFPPGTDFTFPLDPRQKLSVYTGEFVVHTQVVAAKGDHLLQATLRYQACSSNTCLPPHEIPVAIDVIAK
jgi:hypothetical protein